MYVPEILPLKIRAKGAALAAGADFLGNFLVVEVTPDGVKNLGWKFYIVWAVLNLASAIIVWVFYPETGSQPLEAIDALFIEQSAERRGSHLGVTDAVEEEKGGILGRFQWSIVRKADRQMKAYKRSRYRSASQARTLSVETADDHMKSPAGTKLHVEGA